MDKVVNRVTKRLLPGVLALLVCLAASGPGLAQSPQVEVLEETAEHRVIRHAGGETSVPAHPQRVVTLFNHLTDGLLALGVQPVGTVTFEDRGFLPYLEPLLRGTLPVGNIPEPSLEAILAAQPDLILGDPFHAEIYDQLSRIAPTVLIPDEVFTLEQTLVDLGVIFGLQEAAAARLEEHENVIRRAREVLQEVAPGASAVYLSARPEGYWLYGSESGPAKILYDQLGFAPDPLLGTGEASVALSLERLPELRADHIFLSEDDPERARELKESRLFANVPAVQANHVSTVDRDLWLLGHSSPLGAELIVQDVLEFVAGESE